MKITAVMKNMKNSPDHTLRLGDKQQAHQRLLTEQGIYYQDSGNGAFEYA